MKDLKNCMHMYKHTSIEKHTLILEVQSPLAKTNKKTTENK